MESTEEMKREQTLWKEPRGDEDGADPREEEMVSYVLVEQKGLLQWGGEWERGKHKRKTREYTYDVVLEERDEVVDCSHGKQLWELCREKYEPLWLKGGNHCDLELYPEYIRRLKKFVYFSFDRQEVRIFCGETTFSETLLRSTDQFEQPRRSTDVFEASRKSIDRREKPRQSVDRPEKLKNQSHNADKLENKKSYLT
ncbi:hypothetical protein RHMOL_Rhmol10G0019700 [Rhododendron molle]|uniref:Uncharacterized protein n=1 Tax=Rhododendron molle TaxID=49168 RepID=A0ACC0LZM0_RHOML|nr:hypothetical protein RHMOL_Rhmol10G0019700 [Rhododendron molle]